LLIPAFTSHISLPEGLGAQTMIKELNHNRPITPLVTGDTGSNKTQYFFWWGCVI
jgi:hypothetical protein